MITIRGYVCVARDRAVQIYGAGGDGMPASFLENGLTPFRSVAEAERGAGRLKSATLDDGGLVFRSVKPHTIVMEVAECQADFDRIMRSRRRIVLLALAKSTGPGLDARGCTILGPPAAGCLETAGAYADFLDNGLRPFRDPTTAKLAYVQACRRKGRRTAVAYLALGHHGYSFRR